MPRPGRLAFVSVAVAALLAAGCFGSRTPASVGTLRTKPKATPSSTKVANATPTPIPTIGTAGNPRLTDRTPKPGTPRPTVTVSVAPNPAVSNAVAYPEIALQPVVINPEGSIGLAAEAQNYAVVSSAAGSVVRELGLIAEDAGESGYRSSVSGYRLADTRPAKGSPDAHAAFQRWQRQLHVPAGGGQAPYKLQQATGGVAKGSNLKFWVITSFEGENFKEAQITARVLEAGSHCYVVVDADALRNPGEAGLLTAKAKEIAKVFDATIYPTNTRIFGSEPNPGVDGDSKIFILLTPAVGNYGADTTLGYFSQRDEFVPKADSPAVFKHSNQKEMLYVSSRIVLEGSADDYLGTIAHEFQHMINFNQKVLVGQNRQSDDLWIDEGMAMYAIEANGYGLKAGGEVLSNHVKRFMQEPEAFSLVAWDDNPEAIGYGPVYLFMVYLADRFGEGIIKELVTSKKLGKENFDEVLGKRGMSLARQFHDWTLANLLDGKPHVGTGPHQYTSLQMIGRNGATDLDGFVTERLDVPGREFFPLRPYTAHYFRMPDGVLAPRFTLNAGAGLQAGAVPRLVLPQDDF